MITSGKAGLAAGLSATILPALACVHTRQIIANGGAEDILYIQRPLPYAFKISRSFAFALLNCDFDPVSCIPRIAAISAWS